MDPRYFWEKYKEVKKDKITMFKGINWFLPRDIDNQRIMQCN